jgi:hypothetical protein
MDKTRIGAGSAAFFSLALGTALQMSGYTNPWLATWLFFTAAGSAIFVARPHWGATRVRVRSPIAINVPGEQPAPTKDANDARSRKSLARRADKEIESLNRLRSEHQSRSPTHPDYHGEDEAVSKRDQWERDNHRIRNELFRRYMAEHHSVVTQIVEEARLLGGAKESDSWRVKTASHGDVDTSEVGRILAAIAAKLRSSPPSTLSSEEPPPTESAS